MRLCIVSPHLDDAVLSCGIAMQRALASGGEAVAINIFTDGTGADVRRANDEKAVAVLGGRSIFLDELDAFDRDQRYRSERGIFYGDFSDVPSDFIAHVAERIDKVLAREKPDRVIYPLGVGTHVDHLIAYEVSKILPYPAFYYEERPYVLWPGFLQARMNMLACHSGLPNVTPDDMERARTSCHFLNSGGIFPREVPVAYLAAPTAFSLRGDVHELIADGEELARLYDSLACYESQMPFIYPSREVFLRDSFRYEESRSGEAVYIERSWTLSPI